LANALGATGVSAVTDKEGCVRSVRFVLVLSAALAASLDKTGHVVEKVKSGADGKFTVNLPPGHYTVAPIARGDEPVIPASATANPGRYVHVRVTFSVR
jgi:hypothetical protein